MYNSEAYSFRTILIGDPNVGKTCLSYRLLDNTFGPLYLSTLACEFGTKIFDINDKKLKLQIWDTAGEERYSTLARMYYRKAVGALLVYDITRRESFGNIEKWLYQLREKSHPNMSIILVGNKCDLGEGYNLLRIGIDMCRRVVSYDEGEAFAKENNLGFLETSCKTSENVTEVNIGKS